LYVKNEIPTCDYVELNKSKSESVWCKILRDSTQGQNLIVGVRYKSPNADCNEVNELFKVIEKAAKNKVIITRDCNFPGINWDTLECEANTQDFRNLVLDNYLDQHVLKPQGNRIFWI
jgi:hypothetical protein